MHGVLEGGLGTFDDHEKRNSTALFVLRCTKELATWQEGAEGRMRRWIAIRDVDEVLKKKPANRVMFRAFVESRADLNSNDNMKLDRL